jgi:hypothetical protein
LTRVRSLLLLPFALSLTACAETSSIRQMGHPEFEQVVGAETEFQRADEQQQGQVDAFPDGADAEGDHRFLASIIPIGVEEVVVLDVRAAERPPTGLPLKSLTVGAYALNAEQAGQYAVDGSLPSPETPLIVLTTTEKGEEGVLMLTVQLPRDAIPEGTEKLAFPICVQFQDGWINLVFYQTGIPAVVPTIDPSTMTTGDEEPLPEGTLDDEPMPEGTIADDPMPETPRGTPESLGRELLAAIQALDGARFAACWLDLPDAEPLFGERAREEVIAARRARNAAWDHHRRQSMLDELKRATFVRVDANVIAGEVKGGALVYSVDGQEKTIPLAHLVQAPDGTWKALRLLP